MFKIIVVGKKNGKATINWMGVAMSYLVIVMIIFLTLLTLYVLSKVALGYSFFTLNGWLILGTTLVAIMPTIVLGAGVRRALQFPLEKLDELD